MNIIKIFFRSFAVLLAFSLALPAAAFDVWPTPYALEITHRELNDASRSVSFQTFSPSPGARPLVLQVVSPENPRQNYRSSIYVMNESFVTRLQLNFAWRASGAKGVDIDGDSLADLAIPWMGDSAAGLRIYDWPSLDTLCEYQIREQDYRWRPRPDRWDVGLDPAFTLPIPGTNREGLLLSCYAGYCCMPRGLIFIDPQSGKEIWHRWVASSVLNCYKIQTAANSPSVILGGTTSSSNGAEWDGHTDAESMVFLCSASGEMLWQLPLDGTFSRAIPFPITDSLGITREVVVVRSSRTDSLCPSEILRVDAASGLVLNRLSFKASSLLSTAALWQNPRRPGYQVVVLTSNNELRSYDQDLKLSLWKPGIQSLLEGGDFNHDGDFEALVVDLHGRTLLLREDARTLAWAPFEASNAFLVDSPGADWPAVWAFNSENIVSFRIARNQHYAMGIGARVLSFVLVAMLLGFGPRAFWRMRSQLTQSRAEKNRMEAWSAMAAGLAHDIKTPLAVLRLSGQNLALELEADYGAVPDTVQRYVHIIQTETDRTEDVVRRLLTITRQTPPAFEALDFAALVRSTVERCPHSPDVQIVYEIAAGLPPVRADYQQIISLVQNLASNSFKAMKEKGRLTIRIHAARELQKRSKPRDVIVLEISDTGRGISPEHLPRIFDPYFSHSDGGTGLGLALVKRTVENHYGSIDIQSTVGVGTTVRVQLPFSPENSRESKKSDYSDY